MPPNVPVVPGPNGSHLRENRYAANQRHTQPPMDPNAFQRGGRVAGYYRQTAPPPRQLFDPNARGPLSATQPDYQVKQAQYLDRVASQQVPTVDMSQAERDEKEGFRVKIQRVISEITSSDPDRYPAVSLECFGSFKSGFAGAGSDMDLVIVLPDGTPYNACFSLLEDDLPRSLEKTLLQLGYGARLLTRTRVPIIKICEKPDACLLDKLRQEREKWDLLPVEKKYPHLYPDTGDDDVDIVTNTGDGAGTDQHVHIGAKCVSEDPQESGPISDVLATGENNGTASQLDAAPHNTEHTNDPSVKQAKESQTIGDSEGVTANPQRPPLRPWTRERKAGPLDFPKSGVGIQSDINFFNPLGLHNTQLLRCYSLCDERVRPMVLFVKSWASQRKINSSYSGTLSSYGYVLMVLHFLTNVAQPPVLPNLQMPWRPDPQCTPHGATSTEVDGWTVDFWRSEEQIKRAVHNGQLSTNRESLGSLLAGFYHYYSSQARVGPMFHWMQKVVSLRSPGGVLTKEEKGWVKAVTEESDGKRIQHRYLFCLEDPFELSHNVARTVTHNGIVAIRDEFRRANRILHAQGIGQMPRDGELFAEVLDAEYYEQASKGLKSNGSAENGPSSMPVPDRLGKMNAVKAKDQANVQLNRGQQGGGRVNRETHPPSSKALNTKDEDAFPALGAPKATKSGAKAKADGLNKNMSEISGDRAKAVLDDFKRKKEEEQGELTAAGAAEAVLGDD